jgi:hypothetical protein
LNSYACNDTFEAIVYSGRELKPHSPRINPLYPNIEGRKTIRKKRLGLRLENLQANKEIINAQKKRQVLQLPDNEPWNRVIKLFHHTGVKSKCNLRIQIDYIIQNSS